MRALAAISTIKITFSTRLNVWRTLEKNCNPSLKFVKVSKVKRTTAKPSVSLKSLVGTHI